MFPCLRGCSSTNGVHSSKKEFAPRGANSFLEEVTLLRRGEKKENTVELQWLEL